MKTKKYLLLTILSCLSEIVCVFSQDSIKHTAFIIPQSTEISVRSNFHWFLNDGFDTNFTDQMYVQVSLKYSSNFEFVVINKSKWINNFLQNKFSDVYLNYHNNFKANANIPVFKYGTFLNLKIGVIEWYPTYTNIQLILANADKFINPDQIYGASITSITPLTSDNSLTIHLSAHTGDLIHKKLNPELLDLYTNYTKIFKYNLGLATQIGIAQGSQHVVNFAHILYQPKIEKMQFDFKLGKLPTIDESPYGIHVGFTRTFKYISIGGYYEKRLNQTAGTKIGGISWSIIGPPKLAKFVSAFNWIYDFNTNTIWMWIPILRIDIKNK